MNLFRPVSAQEKALLIRLLDATPQARVFITTLDSIVVSEMSDGGMGSLLLVPSHLRATKRSFGKELVSAEYTDRDGVMVLISINVDNHGDLYELDIWKVNYDRLIAWPMPCEITIVQGKKGDAAL